jgi:hypothetical protein
MSVWLNARALLATIVLAGVWSFALSPAQADAGRIQFTVVKAGVVIGGSQTDFRGTVDNIRRPQDVEGVYAAGSAGAALGRGAQVIVLTNQNGAVLTLSGRSVGAIVSADLNGLALSLHR